MQLSMNRFWRLSLWAGVIVAGMTLTACGGEEERDPCAGVSCDFGVCDSESGECTNEESCNLDSQCIPGYECSDGSCEALTECSGDGDCEAGVCGDSEVCVNPDSCTENGDCLARTYCDIGEDEDEGTCERDPCNDKTCRRGVCERGTDNCISADSCTQESEIVDCVAGQKCANPDDSDSGTCRGTDSFCDNYDCGDNGVCQFGAGGCTDADTCESDSDCLEGKFCNDMGQCRPNLCVQQDVDCEGDGVCQPASGLCENAESCESNEDCVNNPNHLCVDNTCTLEAEACGDADGDGGCPGNQSCEYDGDELTASCAEPETCETSFDCLDDRQCGGETCADPEACSEDQYEPNNSIDEATSFLDVATDNSVGASVCSDDTDVYTFSTEDLAEDPAATGTLLVELDVPERERGLGSLDVSVTNTDDGTELESASTGSMGTDGTLEVPVQIDVPDHGQHSIEVSAGDDVSTAGVDYDLSVNFTTQEAIDACENATTIPIDSSRTSGTTVDSGSSELGSSCTSADNTSSEKIYALELDAPQELQFELTPQLSDTKLTMSLRSRCTQPASERACANSDDVDPGQTEEMTALLSEGTHYLIIQAPAGEDSSGGGPFELNVERVFTTCGPDDNYCGEEGTANLCSTDGGRFNQVDCDAGCDASTGECIPPEGNTCGDATEITPDNSDQSREISLNQLTNEYTIDSGTCAEDDGVSNTGGPDQTYQVTVPPRTTFTAEAEFQNEVEGSLYLVEDCTSASGSCQAGAQDSIEGEDYRERVSYANLSEESEDEDNSKTLYLVVDTAAGESVTTAQLETSFEDVICTPDAKRCDEGTGTNVEQCEPFGRSWEVAQSCGLGCDDGACQGDSCGDAISVTKDGAWHEYTFDNADGSFTDQYNYDGNDCTSSTVDDSAGPEAVFSVDADEGDIIEATWERYDPALYVTDDCSDVAGSCLAGEEDFDTEQVGVTYEANSAGIYYIMADVDEDSGTTYNDDGTFRIRVRSSCDPGNYSASCQSGSVDYCGVVDGTSINAPNQYACGGSGGCTDGKCDTKDAEICYDAENITSAASSGMTRQIDWSNFENDYSRDGACGLSDFETEGPDAVYALDLQEDDVLTASLDQMSSFDDTALSLVGEQGCGAPLNNCLSADDGDLSEINYIADSAQRVYLIADSDDDGTSDTFELEVEIESQECDPATHAATCDGSGNLEYCDQLGFLQTYSCQDGCSNGSCGTPTGGVCADAVTADSGDSFSNDWIGDNNMDPVGTGITGNCSFPEDTAGADWVYEVNLAADEILTADYGGNSSGDSSSDTMYLLSECGNGSDCLDAVGDNETIQYKAGSSSETVYVVMDHGSYTDEPDYGYSLDIDKTASECDPSSHTPQCDGSGNLEYCVEPGLLETYSCDGGCSSGACNSPRGEACFDAVPVSSGDSESQAEYVGTNNIDPVGTGNTGNCSFPEETAGADWVYEVDLAAGEELTADYTGTGALAGGSSYDTMYLLADCSDTSTCIDAVDNDGSITYTAGSSAETVYVVMDHEDYVDETSYGFTVDFTIQ